MIRWLCCLYATVAIAASTDVGAQRIATNESAEAAAVELFAREVTIDLDGVLLKTAVKALAASAGVRVTYQGNLLDAATARVTLHAKKMPFGTALSRVLAGTMLRAEALTKDAVYLSAVRDGSRTVTGIITGTVTDAVSKTPIRGAIVMLDDATRGVITDDNGTFRITGVADGDHTIRVRRVGYSRAMQTVRVENGETRTLAFAMTVTANTLDQVVVTGTVVPTELKAIPNAITVITAKEIEQRGITQIQQLFHGDVPGLFASSRGASATMDEVRLFSRGASEVADAGNRAMKTYIDGVEMANPSYMSQIDPRTIERVEILTGPQASTVYGSNALNGVIQIFTKRGTLASRPQFTLSLVSGLIQNNYSAGKVPFHEYAAGVSGVEGRISYNANLGWDYTGRWAPSKQTARLSVAGGARLQMTKRLTGDFTFRRANTTNKSIGDNNTAVLAQISTGAAYIDPIAGSPGIVPPTQSTADGQTVGGTLTYAVTNWWSHTLNFGGDYSDRTENQTAPSFRTPGTTCYSFGCYANSDTLVSFFVFRQAGRQISYSTTARIPVTSAAVLTITTGGDSRDLFNYSNYNFGLPGLKGTISGTTTSRASQHNSGFFAQTQLGVFDQLFFTFGLRSEWNPTYGDDVRPYTVPRFGVAYTREIAGVTAKLRGAYGRSTRPPAEEASKGRAATPGGWANAVGIFGPHYTMLPNPGLEPEYQRGSDGGLELYFSNRGSLTVTRYDQTVDNLISIINAVDSIPRLDGDPDPYGYCTDYPPLCGDGAYQRQDQYLNVGSIRNIGWETQGRLNLGPIGLMGTYSFTKTRFGGVTPKFADRYPARSYPQYQPGARFNNLPEHTGAVDVSYTSGRTTMSVNTQFTGQMVRTAQYGEIKPRLIEMQPRAGMVSGYQPLRIPYSTSDFNGSWRFSPTVEGVMQIRNLADNYRNDDADIRGVMGRQTKVGLRIRTR
jgi:outer membrane receptor protein involved in Fe transport